MFYPLRRIEKAAHAALDHWLPRLNQQIIKWESSPVPLLKGAGVSSLLAARRAGMLARHGLKYRIFKASGLERSTGNPMTVIHLVEGRSMNYLNHLLFQQGSVVQEKIGSCSLRELAQTAERLASQADLIVVEGDQNWRPRRGEWQSGPIWIRLVFTFLPNETWDQLKLRWKSHHKNLRRVQRAGFTTRISRDEADFEFFYDRMHVPLIQNRHQNYGEPENKETVRKFYKQGFLVLALDAGGQPVAGNVCMVLGDKLLLYTNGVLDGDPVLIESGAQTALYLGCFKAALDQELKKIDAGGCRPFINDGVLSYKFRWGFEPVEDPWQPRRMLFWVPNATPAALHWLTEHPILPKFANYGGEAMGDAYGSRSAASSPV